MQSLKNKLLELTVLLQSDLRNVDILCLTEHLLKEDQLELTTIEHFKLVSLAELEMNMVVHGYM
jgi:hypothetical protein